MSHARALSRCARIAAHTVWCALPLSRNFVSRRSPEGDQRNAAVLNKWSRGLLRIMGCELEVHGPIPDEPGLLVTNHLSYMDIVALASLRRSTFIAKSEIGRWPILGPLTRGVGTILIDRASRRDVVRVLDEMQRSLDSGLTVVLFPEGTTSCGDDVARFKPSLLQSAATERLPVRCASLRYRVGPDDPPVVDSVHWWGKMTLVDHVYRLLKIERVTIEMRFAEEPILHEDRRALAEDLHARVTNLFDVKAAMETGGGRVDAPPG